MEKCVTVKDCLNVLSNIDARRANLRIENQFEELEQEDYNENGTNRKDVSKSFVITERVLDIRGPPALGDTGTRLSTGGTEHVALENDYHRTKASLYKPASVCNTSRNPSPELGSSRGVKKIDVRVVLDDVTVTESPRFIYDKGSFCLRAV